MPVLRITKNGIHLCTVGSNDVWMFSADVHADIWGPACSLLTVTGGGKRRPDGSFDFLIWEMTHELRKGDHLVFSFEEGTESSPNGSLDDDDDDDDDASAEDEARTADFVVSEEEIARMEARPKSNPNCRWRFLAPNEQEIFVVPDDDRQSLNLHILWNEMRAHRMRASLSKTSLRETLSRSGGDEVFLNYFEHAVRIELIIEI
ncbi:hypothetical protein J2W28_003205 [Variovorax boronicumulans]|uniref:hypothetical protein n=1 Tax=Variovorax boronicumulans TaxID=436515 RepID=UPI00277EA9C7|nr:hypothetical protein [Variovorax boronicumulans]MDP9992855.1 hypothetical protein [Variovorax boronicumulans]MDQ0004054.1 hypothetical protein [Variovorax boronicumulans]